MKMEEFISRVNSICLAEFFAHLLCDVLHLRVLQTNCASRKIKTTGLIRLFFAWL